MEMPDWLRYYRNRRVLVTGHTGFKGAWLTVWLKQLGSVVTGLSLEPDSDRPSLFEAAGVADGMQSMIVDIREADALETIVKETSPEIIFHLAAQSLVIESYKSPIETFSTNVMGTTHVLEAAGKVDSVRAVVSVTSDKCYRNQGLHRAYNEEDTLGGTDPYSASKAAAEIVIASYRHAFGRNGPLLASARSGNVIGGGDWADNRLVPDIVRALAAARQPTIRNPASVRPWQYVLEPLAGYLLLAHSLVTHGRTSAEGWNFGPPEESQVSVGELAQLFVDAWGAGDVALPIASGTGDVNGKEAAELRLDSSKARKRLGWKSMMNNHEAVAATIDWYHTYYDARNSMTDLTINQVSSYMGRLSTT